MTKEKIIKTLTIKEHYGIKGHIQREENKQKKGSVTNGQKKVKKGVGDEWCLLKKQNIREFGACRELGLDLEHLPNKDLKLKLLIIAGFL